MEDESTVSESTQSTEQEVEHNEAQEQEQEQGGTVTDSATSVSNATISKEILLRQQQEEEVFLLKTGRVFQDAKHFKKEIVFAHEEQCAMSPYVTISEYDLSDLTNAISLSTESTERSEGGEGDAKPHAEEIKETKAVSKDKGAVLEADEEVEKVDDNDEDATVTQTESCELLQPLKVVSLDWNICENSMEHDTDMYEITQTACKTSYSDLSRLVVRRGRPFIIHITFDRKFDFECDDVTLIFQTGSAPQPSDRTSYPVRVSEGLKQHGWSVGVHLCDDNKIHFKVMTPVTCIIGKFNLTIETKLKIPYEPKEDESEHEEQRFQWKINRFSTSPPMYIIFNPFCQGDQVYMADEIERDEYILNDFGHIFVGNQHDHFRRPWKYAQFAELVLDTCCTLLDLVKLGHSARGDAVAVVRAISNLVSSTDDTGLVKCNWSGAYHQDVAPTQWLSTLQILEEFLRTGQSVKYGQCAVLAACAVTICRCLGIPARCVTIYSAAHDCDGTNSINAHWDFNGEPIKEMNKDHLCTNRLIDIQSYHVWVEAYMSRPDIAEQYNGWQAFDPTPQATSEGMRCAGPCPVVALKEADTHMKDGLMWMFSELNAYKFHWIMEQDGTFRNTINKKGAGMQIKTEYPRQFEHNREQRTNEIIQGLSLLQTYKYKKGTEEETKSLKKANTWATHGGVYDDGQGDVEVEIVMVGHVIAGSTFDSCISLQNKCRYERNVDVTITLTSVQHTGLPNRRIRTERLHVNLCPLEGKHVEMRVTGEDYSLVMTDNLCFMVDVVVKVKETDQVFAGSRYHQLIPPVLDLSVPVVILEGETFECEISFENTLPVTLVDCEFMVNAHGMEFESSRIPLTDIEPYDIFSIMVPMKPKLTRKTQILVSLRSRELNSVYGELIVNM